MQKKTWILRCPPPPPSFCAATSIHFFTRPQSSPLSREVSGLARWCSMALRNSWGITGPLNWWYKLAALRGRAIIRGTCNSTLVPSSGVGSQRLPYSDGLSAYHASNFSLSSMTEHFFHSKALWGGRIIGTQSRVPLRSHKEHYLAMKGGDVCCCGVDGGHWESDHHECFPRLHICIELEAMGRCSLN
jgi:hypothetical protein